jgi:hypothetical protein
MKRLLAALLPSDSREHVLGDLEQRGFRLRDIASVLPTVWFAHLRRSWFGPVPNLAGASEVHFQRRCRQMARAYSAAMILYFGLKCADAWFLRHSIGWLIFFASPLLMGTVVSIMSRNHTYPPGYWRDRYPVILAARTRLQAYVPPFMLALSVPPGVWTIPMAVAAALWARRSARRYAAELAKFQNEPDGKSLA